MKNMTRMPRYHRHYLHVLSIGCDHITVSTGYEHNFFSWWVFWFLIICMLDFNIDDCEERSANAEMFCCRMQNKNDWKRRCRREGKGMVLIHCLLLNWKQIIYCSNVDRKQIISHLNENYAWGYYHIYSTCAAGCGSMSQSVIGFQLWPFSQRSGPWNANYRVFGLRQDKGSKIPAKYPHSNFIKYPPPPPSPPSSQARNIMDWDQF